MLIYLQLIESEEDKSKFEQVYLYYRGLMYVTANKILNNQQDAEDAVHQAFVSLAENVDKISEPVCTKTRAYVVTIVERKAVDIYRSKKRKAAVPFDEETMGLRVSVPKNDVADAIARLPARYRAFILLKYDSGYSNGELAQMLGLTYEGVHSLDRRAKAAFRKELEKEEITP